MELTKAATDVLTERCRQVEAEGWTQEHDDRHNKGQMAAAAGVYALHSGGYNLQMVDGAPSAYWPWAPEWWKPADARRNLVKAAALILAEIERLDRSTDSIKIVQINDCDWWIGESLDACVSDYKENVEDAPDYTDNARELADEELDLLKFAICDEDERPTGQKRTFREQLAIEIAEGGDFPRMFASTES